MSFSNQRLVWGGAAVLVALYVLKQKSGKWFDITSKENLASQAAESLYGGGFDGQGTIGTDFYDVNTEYSPYALADRARENIGDWWDELWKAD